MYVVVGVDVGDGICNFMVCVVVWVEVVDGL